MLLTTLIDLQGPAGWAALLAPFALLAVVLMVALLRAPAPPANLGREVAPATSEQEKVPTEAPAARGAVGRDGVMPDAVHSGATAAAAAEAASVVTAPKAPPPKVGDTINALRSQIVGAEAAFDHATVARLSLELAQLMGASAGNASDIEKHLRRAIVLATQLGDTVVHAAARLELGDHVAMRDDMTTACEHWQMARQIYWDESRAAELASVDQRMIKAGCPTDWVLNDF